MPDLENPMVSGYGFKDELTYTPPVAFPCDDCGEAVYEGDRYLRVCGLSICESCADSNWETAVADEECMNFGED